METCSVLRLLFFESMATKRPLEIHSKTPANVTLHIRKCHQSFHCHRGEWQMGVISNLAELSL